MNWIEQVLTIFNKIKQICQICSKMPNLNLVNKTWIKDQRKFAIHEINWVQLTEMEITTEIKFYTTYITLQYTTPR